LFLPPAPWQQLELDLFDPFELPASWNIRDDRAPTWARVSTPVTYETYAGSDGVLIPF
jgi:hypothetical protein